MAPSPSTLCVVSPEVWCHSGYAHCCSSRGPEFVLCFLIAVCWLLWSTFYSSFPEKKIFGNEIFRFFLTGYVNVGTDWEGQMTQEALLLLKASQKYPFIEISPSLRPSIFPEKKLHSASREYNQNVGVVDLKDRSVQWTAFSQNVLSSTTYDLSSLATAEPWRISIRFLVGGDS